MERQDGFVSLAKKLDELCKRHPFNRYVRTDYFDLMRDIPNAREISWWYSEQARTTFREIIKRNPDYWITQERMEQMALEAFTNIAREKHPDASDMKIQARFAKYTREPKQKEFYACLCQDKTRKAPEMTWVELYEQEKKKSEGK